MAKALLFIYDNANILHLYKKEGANLFPLRAHFVCIPFLLSFFTPKHSKPISTRTQRHRNYANMSVIC